MDVENVEKGEALLPNEEIPEEIRRLSMKTEEIIKEGIIRQCRLNGKLTQNHNVDKFCSKYFSFKHFFYLIHRYFVCTARHRWKLLTIEAVFCLLIGCFLILLYGDVGENDGCFDLQPKVHNFSDQVAQFEKENIVMKNFKFLFFGVVFLNFISMAGVVLTFPSDVKIFLNEHANGWYSSSSYFWAISSHDVPFFLVLGYVYGMLIYYGTLQINEQFRFGYFILYLLLGNQAATSCGLVVGIICAKNLQIAVCTFVAWFLWSVLLCGFFIILYDLPIVFQYCAYSSFIRFPMENVIITIYGLDRCDPRTQASLAMTVFRYDEDLFWENNYWVIGHIVFWRALAYIVLMLRANGSVFNLKSIKCCVSPFRLACFKRK